MLVQGESGTGKELVAQAIHEHSRRREGPFVPINCAAIPHDLLEAELFGHEKGAYTGAHIRRRGKIEFADGGTVFLDEIGELDLALQAKLLRFLQDHKVERIGGRESIAVDVRVISATNSDLTNLMAGGRFREDLYYRLTVVSLRSPRSGSALKTSSCWPTPSSAASAARPGSPLRGDSRPKRSRP